nr:acetyl-CoA carboxylase biotin carboxylase subunit [Acidisarcina polymorpha]
MRIIRACRELDIRTVALYSDADRAAPHVLAAHEAYRLGPAPAIDSYLRGDLILDIARRSSADAIHPGYGFLSENADFAESCEAAGVKFIGPGAAAMRALGSKTLARQAADAIGIPRVPGSTTGLRSQEEALKVALQIGYPVMLKAAAGGGGKGMRAVRNADEMESAYAGASSEAERAFGSAEVYLEKLIDRPRHIEIQILADQQGNCIHLGERDCSIQRRHQKVIEEAPSAIMDDQTRQSMGKAAVRLAQSAGYCNAGTVEFLLERQANGRPGNFYFLEMNTRLQVEHPVTELVTGLDLVHLQIAIAEGKPLPLSQQEVEHRGHAIECRIYAEDHENGFMPSPGTITRLLQPSGPGIREDSGIYEGWSVPLDYDPMLSKLIAYAPTRAMAIARMLRALEEYAIGGIRTNLGLFARILREPDFQAGEIDTGYLDRLLSQEPPEIVRSPISLPDKVPAFPNLDVATLAAGFFSSRSRADRQDGESHPANNSSQWKQTARREGLRS